MSRLLPVACCLLPVACCLLLTTSPDGPQLGVLETPAVYEFDLIATDDLLEIRIPVKNMGPIPCKLESVAATCACVRTEVPAKHIPSGATEYVRCWIHSPFAPSQAPNGEFLGKREVSFHLTVTGSFETQREVGRTTIPCRGFVSNPAQLHGGNVLHMSCDALDRKTLRWEETIALPADVKLRSVCGASDSFTWVIVGTTDASRSAVQGMMTNGDLTDTRTKTSYVDFGLENAHGRHFVIRLPVRYRSVPFFTKSPSAVLLRACSAPNNLARISLQPDPGCRIRDIKILTPTNEDWNIRTLCTDIESVIEVRLLRSGPLRKEMLDLEVLLSFPDGTSESRTARIPLIAAVE